MNWLERARQLDSQDPLAEWVGRFHLPGNMIYLDGNSLGALPVGVDTALLGAVEEEWGRDLVASWNSHHWIELPRRVGDQIGRWLGAADGQTLCADNLSINLFKLLYVALCLRPGRSVILTERGNFPTDSYIAEGLAAMLGPDRCSVRYIDASALETADLSDVAVVSLAHVNFRTGAMLDMQSVTTRVQAAGALMLWDLAHSVGVTALKLDHCNVDMAVGCTYKFLNGGPGAPGFLYLANRHLENAPVAIQGWMGHSDLFAFDAQYTASPGIERFLTGTQSVLGMRTVEAALASVAAVPVAAVRIKSQAMTTFFLEVIAHLPNAARLPCITPRDVRLRGSQICLTHPNAYAVAQALIDDGVVVDFREPNIVRFGFAPLYLKFQSVLESLLRLEALLEDGAWQAKRYTERKKVT